MIKINDVINTGLALKDITSLEELLLKNKAVDEVCGFLIKNKDWELRRLAAKHGYGLEVLIKDESSLVRIEVAKHSLLKPGQLKLLVNDNDANVRKTAKEMMTWIS